MATLALAPLSVVPEHQSCGVGKQLVGAARKSAADLAFGSNLLVGIPSYYPQFGKVVPKGAANIFRLVAILGNPDSSLPDQAVATSRVLVDALVSLDAQIEKLDAEITLHAKENEFARRFRTIPGIGPLITTTIAVLAPPPETFRRSRDFAAWLGLVPRQHSTGGKRLRATTKMGERPRCRLLIIEANRQRGLASGSAGYCRASRPCWSELRWPTRWRASSGH